MRSNIFAAIGICRQQIDVNVNLPWAFYNLGKLYLFLGEPYESLTAYAKAIQLSAEPWIVDSSFQALARLKPVQKQLQGYEWVRRLLLIGLASCSGEHMHELMALSPEDKLKGPVVVMAGGCDTAIRGTPDAYHGLITQAFDGFNGTVLSSGIDAGISGHVGELGSKHPHIRTIGYLPRLIPSDLSRDRRYTEFRYTENEYRYVEDNGFCALETLKKWADIVASGIKPGGVNVLGFGGGRQAALEYRLALALGAHVALIEGSGNEAARLLSDDDWRAPNPPVSLPDDIMTLRLFIGIRDPIPDPALRDRLGRRIHEIYCDNQFRERVSKEESMKGWDALLPYLKESNMQQADDMVYKLQRMGFSVKKAIVGIKPIVFTPGEAERMAEMEHGRWNAERLLDGWVYGKVKDVTRKVSPHLVSWKDLSDDFKYSNRDQASHIWRRLHERNYGVALMARREKPFRFTDEEIEALAEKEHERFVTERRMRGWKDGEYSEENKTSPYLIPYGHLAEDIKDYDRNFVRKLPDILASIDLKIVTLNEGACLPERTVARKELVAPVIVGR